MDTSLIEQMPKVELHTHLEGALRAEAIADIGRRFHLPFPSYDPEQLRPYVEAGGRTRSLADWGPIFNILRRCFVDRETVAELTFQVAGEYARQHTRYLEVRFSPGYMEKLNGIPMDDAVLGVLEGLTQARRQHPIRTGVIVLTTRDLGPEMAEAVAECAARFAGRGVVGFDLAGNERGNPPERFARAFHRARSAGLHVTVHAGEEVGPESIAGALATLGAERIGHGLRLGEDPRLLERVRAGGITLEMCPTSNVQTGNIPDLSSHPAHDYYRAGLNVTINADDPGVCATTLEQEYQLAVTHLGFTLPELADTVLTAARAAFLPPAESKELVQEIRQSLQVLGIEPNQRG